MSKFGTSCLPGPGNLFTWPRVLSLPTPGNLFAQRVQQLVVVAAAPMILADSRPDDQPFSLHQFAQRLFYLMDCNGATTARACRLEGGGGAQGCIERQIS